MGFKTFECCICSKETTKPKSFAIEGKGRACREHQEAQLGRTAALEAEQKLIQKRIDDQKKKVQGWQNHHVGDVRSAGFADPKTFCWCCNKPGVLEHILMERYLLENMKTMLVKDSEMTPSELKLRQQVRERLMDQNPIKQFPLEMLNARVSWNSIITNRTMMNLAKFTSIFIACQACAVKHHLNWGYDRPNVSLDTMAFFGGLIEPVIKSMAQKELDANARNRDA